MLNFHSLFSTIQSHSDNYVFILLARAFRVSKRETVDVESISKFL